MDFSGRLPLWAARWGKQALIRQCARIRKRAFDRGYRQRAYVAGDLTFHHVGSILNGPSSIPVPYPPDWRFVVGVDLAGSKRPGNAIFVMAVTGDYTRIPVDIRAIKGSSPDVANELSEVYRVYKPKIIMIETNAYQSALVEWIKARGEDYPWWTCIEAWTTTNNKWKPDTGLPSLDVEFNAGAWAVPKSMQGHGPECDCGACLWLDELQTHPLHATTDLVMAQWFAMQAARRLGEGEALLNSMYGHNVQPSRDGRLDIGALLDGF